MAKLKSTPEPKSTEGREAQKNLKMALRKYISAAKDTTALFLVLQHGQGNTLPLHVNYYIRKLPLHVNYIRQKTLSAMEFMSKADAYFQSVESVTSKEDISRMADAQNVWGQLLRKVVAGAINNLESNEKIKPRGS